MVRGGKVKKQNESNGNNLRNSSCNGSWFMQRAGSTCVF
jgi:hypothetical protein